MSLGGQTRAKTLQNTQNHSSKMEKIEKIEKHRFLPTWFLVVSRQYFGHFGHFEVFWSIFECLWEAKQGQKRSKMLKNTQKHSCRSCCATAAGGCLQPPQEVARATAVGGCGRRSRAAAERLTTRLWRLMPFGEPR